MVWNWKEAFERVEEDEDLLMELMDLFREEAAALLRSVEGAVGEREGTQVAQAAHTLKGAAGNVGAEEVYELAWQMEQMGREERWEGMEEMCRRLRQALERFLDTVKAFQERGFPWKS
jgi:HPt (histidine-containing phosphotransfer) domain-containing protein